MVKASGEHAISRKYGWFMLLDNQLFAKAKHPSRLNLMFTAAAVATNVCALPVGVVLDKYGPRVSGIVGSILLAVGVLFLAFAAQLPFDTYVLGYVFLALGGPFIFISSFQLSNTFSEHSGLILALLTGAFDSSSAIFLFYRLIYESSSSIVSLQKFFLFYLIVPTCILLSQLTLMPYKSYESLAHEGIIKPRRTRSNSSPEPENDVAAQTKPITEELNADQDRNVSETTSLLEDKRFDEQHDQKRRQKNISGVWGVLHGQSALQQIRTAWFVLIAIFTIVQMIRINYFVATIRTQYSYILNDDSRAQELNHVFDIGLPLGGIISVPFVGLILDNFSTPFVLGLLVIIATAIGILGVLPFVWAAYANIAIFVLYRPFYYTAVSDYAAKVFGFHTFGKVYGLLICVAGLLNFSQTGLDMATHKFFNSNPTPVNMILLSVALLIGLALVGFVWHQKRHMARRYLEDEAENAPDTSITDIYRI